MTVIIKSTEDRTKIDQTLKNLKRTGKLDSHKYCGKIKLAKDPLKIQKELRDEW